MNNQAKSLQCDLLVIGGGINGVGVARDAAGRGLSVILCEKDDLASHTSSASSKLIHGGLRYLEFYEFGLVRKALKEREKLMCIAPHLIKPLRIVMPYRDGLRPKWLLRAGLFLYDRLASRAILPSSSSVTLDKTQELNSKYTHGFEYSDAWVDDARLVVLNAVDAAEHGANVLTRTQCVSLTQKDESWQAVLNNKGKQLEVNARCVVNAAGAWAKELSSQVEVKKSNTRLRLVQGSHIVVRRLFKHDKAFIFQHPDGRIVFVTPYENNFTLIGTTDVEYKGDPNHVVITEAEKNYLCELSNQYFEEPISPKDIVWTYSGVRALVDDGGNDAQSVTRDYRLELQNKNAPIVNIFGGKVTTYRRLAEDVMKLICPLLGFHSPNWTADQCLPGGDVFGELPSTDSVLQFASFIQACVERYDWLPNKLTTRYANAYGTRIHHLLYSCKQIEDLGECIAEGLYEKEVQYLINKEFAMSAQDILWRRSKLGLHLQADLEIKLNDWMERNKQNY